MQVPEEKKKYVCTGSHNYVFYSLEDKRKIADILKMDPVILPLFSAFIFHGYFHHTGAEYLRSANLGYHVYLHPQDMPTNNKTAFGYEYNLCIFDKGQGNRAEKMNANFEEDDITSNVVVIRE